eukprot:TRINITY_DN26839_c0_g1_i1.p1 TRINITY_DN26839_c0_g1~~TRINITY_DN26839_c0_g1_i1.p1  ORF type:complete len:932 (-),score=180.61 TRINITY_DN26839_c0_g1_i1:84-2879(-)
MEPVKKLTTTSSRGSLTSLRLSANISEYITQPDAESLSTTKTTVSLRSTRKHVPTEPDPVVEKGPSIVTISNAIVSNTLVTVMSVCLTFWALTADDLRMGVTQRDADVWFDSMVIFCLLFFTAEIILASFGKPDYFPGLFFVLDVISTVSLVLDLTWVSEAMEGGKEAKGGRTAKFGAGVGRMVRVLRLVRIVKLYKAYHDKTAAQNNDKETTDGAGPGELEQDTEDEEEQQKLEESVVGKKLSDLLTRKVIFMVLAMLIFLPQIDMSDVQMIPSSPAWGIEEVWRYLAVVESEKDAKGTVDRQPYERELLRYIYSHSFSTLYSSHLFWFGVKGTDEGALTKLRNLSYLTKTAVADFEKQIVLDDGPNMLHPLTVLPAHTRELLYEPWEECQWGSTKMYGRSLLARPMEGVSEYLIRCPGDLRPQETAVFQPLLVPSSSSIEDAHIVAFFDIRQFTSTQALYSIANTFFVCLVLMVGSIAFSSDANSIVLQPVEAMMAKVNRICDDPLIAMKLSDQEFRAEEKARAMADKSKESRFARWQRKICCASTKKSDPMETAILERTIIKLGSLLALGFGVAGVEIVSHNMKGASTDINVMIPGSRVDCIIGTTRVDDFSLITEALQSKVMMFVNQIAEIVHGIVDQFHGAPNTNNGSSFLLIWRAEGLRGNMLTRLVDMSVFAFVRIIGALHTSHVLARYRAHPCLKQLLGGSFRVNLSMGLHFGWAIEGAVGSEFKVDASYLSPTMSIAESVQRASKVYDVTIVATDDVMSRCSSGLVQHCRVIDKVQFKGSKEPFELFTIDLDYRSLRVKKCSLAKHWNIHQRFKARQLLEVEKRKLWDEDVEISTLFTEDNDIKVMRKRFTEIFLETFKMGYHNYAEGEWTAARRYLTESRMMLGEDGPSRALLSFMEGTKFEAPAGWSGVRELEEDRVVAE